ncbi:MULTISPECIES: RNA polymerase sigma factor RpoE [unclassified Endozoicomonas]|uniref:RNA polymerase sigma factor RpoE n=1 Tax=unclassified Endozoicomonas TaxID=2644528 RepID=UPI002147F4D2|nr:MULTISPECIES: RNA polymerase sigma factor RpoE [unclassified Endozoicomonas]
MVEQPQADKQLVERVQKGDKTAFDMLVLKYQHRVLGLVGSYITDYQEVQDVAQEAFIKAYRAIDKFRGDSSFYTWLYRIAVNTAKNYLVSKGRKIPESEVDVHDADLLDTVTAIRVVETPERNLYRDEIEQVIHDVIRRLPDELRTAVVLREFDGLSYDEIANVMDCPVGTVRSRIFRAREAIDKVVEPLLRRNS